jgi:hypothetical protein
MRRMQMEDHGKRRKNWGEMARKIKRVEEEIPKQAKITVTTWAGTWSKEKKIRLHKKSLD